MTPKTLVFEVPWQDAGKFIHEFLGRVNEKPVKFDGKIHLAETVLFGMMTAHPLYRTSGPDTQSNFSKVAMIDVSVHILDYRGICEDGVKRYTGWNRIFHPSRKRWERTKTPIYELADFDEAFRFLKSEE